MKEIHSVSEYLEKCFAVNREREKMYFYRGVDTLKPLETRHVPSIYYDKWRIENEDKIFYETVAMFPDEMINLRSTIEKLIFMQHFRLPTRLLDISSNPLIGLFFACFPDKHPDNMNKDGYVYLYAVPDNDIKQSDRPTATILANLAKMDKDFSIRGLYDTENPEETTKKWPVNSLEFYSTHDTIGNINRIEKEDLTSVFCMRPYNNNPRIVRQDGYFFIFGIDEEKRKPAEINRDWILDPIVIPNDCKKNILKDLEKLNINEAFVYPDFEHFSNTLEKKFKKERADF
jgi:hypothetical protein